MVVQRPHRDGASALVVQRPHRGGRAMILLPGVLGKNRRRKITIEPDIRKSPKLPRSSQEFFYHSSEVQGNCRRGSGTRAQRGNVSSNSTKTGTAALRIHTADPTNKTFGAIIKSKTKAVLRRGSGAVLRIQDHGTT